MDWLFYLALIVVFYFLDYWGITIVRRNTIELNAFLRIGILSFLYTFVFGIGILGGGGDPGFALPAPILVAVYFDKPNMIMGPNTIIFSFWWILIFAIISIRKLIKKKAA